MKRAVKEKRRYRRLPWEEWYELARRYYRENGDLLIPEDYESKEGYKLGRWIERQRMNCRKRPELIGEERRRKLNEIGMVWSLEKRYEWEFWISRCEEYYQEHSDLEVPVRYEREGVRLGYWIVQQRRRRQRGEMSEREKEDLERYGMRWQSAGRRRWEEWYRIAERYYQQYGNLDVKISYADAEGNRLGMWIGVQRERYRKRRKPYMSEEEKKALNRLGMRW